MKVMLVDDSKTMRNIQKNILAQLGVTEVQEAVDGQDALSKVATDLPDLLLVDWNMPNMDGLTFVKHFRDGNKTTPIIMVTTEAEKSRVHRSHQSRRQQLRGQALHARCLAGANSGNDGQMTLPNGKDLCLRSDSPVDDNMYQYWQISKRPLMHFII